MTLTGPEALRSIEEALRDIRREEGDVTRRLARSAERITRIRESEGDLLRQLGAVRLDAGRQRALEDSILGAARTARDRLKQHTRTLSRLEAELKTLDQGIATLDAERAEALQQVERLQGELKAISARIAQALAADQDYQFKRRMAAEAARRARECIVKTNQADLDREAKGRPYRADPLFNYLWEAGFGTARYRAAPLVARLDAWVARLIGYDEARRNYVMLNEWPLQLRAFAERQVERAADAQSAAEAHFDAAIDTAGGKPLRADLAAIRASISDIDSRIVAAEDRREETSRLQRELAQGNDPEFAEAIAALAGVLGRADVGELLDEARRSGVDGLDALIAQIDGLRRRVGEEEADAADLRERLRTLAARRRELEDIQYEFKKARFDDPRSSFRDARLAGEELDGFLRGTLAAASYWDHWQKAQQWQSGFGSRPGPWGEAGGSLPDAALAAGGRRRGRGGVSVPGFTRPRPSGVAPREAGTLRAGSGS
jgi:chromosome segregation ATPase